MAIAINRNAKINLRSIAKKKDHSSVATFFTCFPIVKIDDVIWVIGCHHNTETSTSESKHFIASSRVNEIRKIANYGNHKELKNLQQSTTGNKVFQLTTFAGQKLACHFGV